MSTHLEWNNGSLYRWRGLRRDYIGSVIQSAFLNSWYVYVRGELKHQLNSEAAAHVALEKYANE